MGRRRGKKGQPNAYFQSLGTRALKSKAYLQTLKSSARPRPSGAGGFKGPVASLQERVEETADLFLVDQPFLLRPSAKLSHLHRCALKVPDYFQHLPMLLLPRGLHAIRILRNL